MKSSEFISINWHAHLIKITLNKTKIYLGWQIIVLPKLHYYIIRAKKKKKLIFTSTFI